MFSHHNMNEDNEELNTLNDNLDDKKIKKSEEIAQESEEIAQESEEIAQESEEIAQESEEIAQESEEIAQESEEIAQESEEIEDVYAETENLEKMILSTGIRVGTPVKTKSMAPYIIRSNPEGLYILDISKTLYRIDIAAKFIGRSNITKIAVTSAREYGKKPIEKFCELTGATPILGRFMPGTFTNPSLPKYLEPEIVLCNRSTSRSSSSDRSNKSRSSCYLSS